MLIGQTVSSLSPTGTRPGGETQALHTLKNARGFSVQVLPYGATIASVLAPDRHGRFADVVLGLSTPAAYLGEHPYLGAVAGRVAGRISRARFPLEGRVYELAANDGVHHAHGGVTGFSRKLWSVEAEGPQSLRLACLSPDGEEGYPGTVRTALTYTVTDENAIVLEIEATSDRPTPFSLTQHSYFNLAGQGDILDHELQIFAGEFAPMNEDLSLTGRREPVAANDFRRPRRLGEAIPQLFHEHGDLYFLPEAKSVRPAAILRDPASGRVLTVSTDEDCLQLYTGAFLDGRPHSPHAGLCLECEGYPDALNTPHLGDITLRPGETFRRTTIFAFSTF